MGVKFVTNADWQRMQQNVQQRYRSQLAEMQDPNSHYNNGGFWGGVGYVGEKVGLGATRMVEGAADRLAIDAEKAGALAKSDTEYQLSGWNQIWSWLTGSEKAKKRADEYRKQAEKTLDFAYKDTSFEESVLGNDWVDYSHADKWYNPSRGWQIAGDVAGGIGSSVPMIALGFASGGASLGFSFLGAAGSSMADAYKETGKYNNDVYNYGTLSGLTEAGVEALTMGIGTGTGKIINSLSGVGKGAAKAATSKVAGSFLKSAGKGAWSLTKDAISEGVEEGIASVMSPIYQQLTYNPDAQINWSDVAYESLIGAISGIFFGGAHGGISATANTFSRVSTGSAIYNNGKTDVWVGAAKELIAKDTDTNGANTAEVRDALARFENATKKTDGQATSKAQQYLLGALQQSVMRQVVTPTLVAEGVNAARNASAIADYYNSLGGKDASGKTFHIDAADILEGIDTNLLDATDAKSQKLLAKQVEKMLKEGGALARLAVVNAANSIMADTHKMAQGITTGTEQATAQNWNDILDRADANTINELAYKLGGDPRAMSAEQVRAAVEAARAAQATSPKNKKRLPDKIHDAFSQGAHRYTLPNGRADISIIRDGDLFYLYDHGKDRLMASGIDIDAVNKLLADEAEWNAKKNAEKKEAPQSEADNSERGGLNEESANIAAILRDNIKQYSEMSAKDRTTLRRIYRQAIANGMSQQDALACAAVAARSGLNVVIDKARCIGRFKDEEGKEHVKYTKGFYSGERGTIVVNPDAKTDVLLIHELDHALRTKYKNGAMSVSFYADAIKQVPTEKLASIINAYENVDTKLASKEAQYADEANAYYAETALGNMDVLRYLVADRPSLKQRILSFFKKASADYVGVPKLEGYAKKYLKQYKKAFDQFSAEGVGTLALAETVDDATSAVESGAVQYSFAGVNAKTADKMKLDTAREMLKNGVDSETVRKETGWFEGYDGKWRFEIDDSDAVWHLDTAKPDAERLHYFGERIYKLGDLLEHPALYESYPALKDATVWVNPDSEDSGYVVGRNTDTFAVKSLQNTNFTKDVFIHEIQHLVQNIEGFAAGASPKQFDYKAWGEKEYAAYEKRSEIASKLYAVLRRHGVSITAKDATAVRREFDVKDSILDSNFMLLERLADDNPRTRALLDEYYDQVQILNLTTPEGQYHAVAGEIEAHDAQARRRKTADERKNTRPNIDRTDVINAKETAVSYFSKNQYDAETAGIHEQIRHAQSKLNALEPVFFGTTPTKVGKAYEAGTWAIGELKKHGFQADRKDFGKVSFDETSIRDAMKYLDTDAEKVSIVGIYKVIKQGIVIGEHGNHKDRGKHTITFGAPVVINGTRGNMAVVVNMRNNKYKVHRILMPDGSVFKFEDIKNDAEQEMQRGVPKGSLANATSSASTISITDPAPKVNPSDKKSSGRQYSIEIGDQNVAVEVEENNDLLAIHNLTEQNLLDTIKLGGFPMPSIAIVRAKQGHTNFGDISVVFGRETIDPEYSRDNKVYGADAWTPTTYHARTEYEVDGTKARKLEEKLYELSKKVAGGTFSNTSMLRRMGVDNVTEQSASRIAERLANTDEARAAYLAEQGKDVAPEYKEKVYNTFGNEALQEYIDTVGVQHLAGVISESLATNDSALQSEADTVRAIIRKAYEKKHSSFLKKHPELAQKRVDAFMENHVTLFTLEDFVKDAWEYHEDGGTVTEEIDLLATSEKLREAVDDRAVQAWLEPQIAELLGEPGIYNGRDLFTPSGNRRSFAATHYSYTVENVVKAMKNSPARGVNTFGANANALIATATPSYRSVDEIRADKSRLKTEDAEKYGKMLSDLEASLEAVEDDIMRTTKHYSNNSFEERQNIGYAIMEAASGTRSAVAIQRVFAKEGYTITLAQAKKVMALYEAAAQMPTGYFEAKPERVVNFSEIKMVELPDTASEKLKQQLSDRGIPFEVYGRTDAERVASVQRLENVRFSLPLEDSTGATLTDAQREFFAQTKQLDAKGNLQAMYQGAQEEFFVFDRKKSRASNLYGRGFYFTNSADQARHYGNVRGYYLNITNPVSATERTITKAQMRKFLDAVAQNEDYSIENYGTYDVDKILASVYSTDKTDFSMLYDVSLTAVGDMVEAVELFNEVNGTTYDGLILETESVTFQSNQAKLTTNKTPTAKSDMRYSIDLDNAGESVGNAKTAKITAEMSDSERATILDSKKISAPMYKGEADTAINREMSNLSHYKIGVVKATLERMAEEFGVIGEEIVIEDVDVRVKLSKTNVGESLSKEATPIQMAKLLPILKEVAKASVGIETHNNRYYFDSDTVYFENLLGGYVDGDSFVPVRFGLKYSVSGKATLYVVVDQNKIPVSSLREIKKTEVLKTPAANADPEASHSVAYSIAQIIEFVNSGDLLRYVPDQMLSKTQKATKYEAIAETIAKTNAKNDGKYAEYISKGNLQAARQMVVGAAKKAGYTVKVYHGTPDARATDASGGKRKNSIFTVFDSSQSDSERIDGGAHYFTNNRSLAKFYAPDVNERSWDKSREPRIYETFLNLGNTLVINGEGASWRKIPIPNSIPKRITKGIDGEAYSWSHASTKYFTEYAKANGYDSVTFLDIVDGHEDRTDFRGNVYAVFNSNRIKSADLITYDDDGNIIPLSQRFNPKNPDIRYSLDLEGISETDAKLLSALTIDDFLAELDDFELGSSDISVSEVSEKMDVSPKTIRILTRRAGLGDTYIADRNRAVMSQKRIDEEIRSYGATNPTYAQRYITEISTRDFIDLTVRMQNLDRDQFDTNVRGDYGGTMADYDYMSALPVASTPYFVIDKTTGQITGHNGRHRIRALEMAGIKSVEIEVELHDEDGRIIKYGAETIPDLAISSQFDTGIETHLYNVIPLNNSHRAEIESTYGEKAHKGAAVQYSVPLEPATETELKQAEELQREIPTKKRTKKTAKERTEAKLKQYFSTEGSYEMLRSVYGLKDLSPKSIQGMSNQIWRAMNASVSADEKALIAWNTAGYIVDRLMTTDLNVENPAARAAMEELAYLRTGIGKLKFADTDVAELKHAFGKDGMSKIRGRWGYKGKGAAYPMEQFVVDIAREMPGMAYIEDMHPAEAFKVVMEKYDAALEASKEKWISELDGASDIELDSIRNGLAQEILDGFDYLGAESSYASLESKLETFRARAERYKLKSELVADRAKAEMRLMRMLSNLRSVKVGEFRNATQPDMSERLRVVFKTLSKIDFQGTLSVGTVREQMRILSKWYEDAKSNIVGFKSADDPGLYNGDIDSAMLSIASKPDSEKISNQEIKDLYDIASYFRSFVENYGKVWYAGNVVDSKETAQGFIDKAAPVDIKIKNIGILQSEDKLNRFRNYVDDIGTVVARADRYREGGFWTSMHNQVRAAELAANLARIDALAEHDAFVDKHKKYLYKAGKEIVKFDGKQLTKMHLISLYMTCKREQAWRGIALSGYSYTIPKTDLVQRFQDGLLDKDATDAEIAQFVADKRAAIEKLLTKEDMEYIRILEKAYNGTLRDMKMKRDYERQGYSNVADGYYYPIRRGAMPKTAERMMQEAYNSFNNSAFNKNTVEHAAQELVLDNAEALFQRHVRAVSNYAHVGGVVDTFNVLFNLDVSDNHNRPTSIQTVTHNAWAKGHEYFVNLFSDIKGTRMQSEINQFLGAIRGKSAVAALGANFKVLGTQFSSLIASTSVIDPENFFIAIKGGTSNAKDAAGLKEVDHYCDLARFRRADNSAARAQGGIDGTLSKWGEFLMGGIGAMDRAVVLIEWRACQVQVARQMGENFKLGSEANKVEAGKLLTKVIQDTQQNSLKSERTAAMRSPEQIMKAATMFTADQTKVFGRVLQTWGTVIELQKQINAATNAQEKASLIKMRKQAHKKMTRATVALAGQSIYMALITLLFNSFYGRRDDDDDSWVEEVGHDFITGMFSGIPLVKDIMSFAFEGYEISDMSFDAVNNVLNSCKNIFTLLNKEDRTSQDIANGIKTITFSLSQMLGLPVRNIYNTSYGILNVTGKVGSDTAVGWRWQVDKLFRNTSLESDLKKALERDDDVQVDYILDLIGKDRFGTTFSTTTRDELRRLAKSGYTALPKSIGDTVTINGTEYKLTTEQQTAISKYYREALPSLNTLVESKAYSDLSIVDKEKAIEQLLSVTYDDALCRALDLEEDNAVLTSRVVGASTYALYRVKTSRIDSTVVNGVTVSGSKKRKTVAAINAMDISDAQKVLLLYKSGYSVADGDIGNMTAKAARTRLAIYLNTYSGDEYEKQELAKMCKMTLKNGKFVANTE